MVPVGPLSRLLSLALRLFGMDTGSARVVAALVMPSILGGMLLGITFGALPTLAAMFVLRALDLWGRTAFAVILCLWLGGGSLSGAILLSRRALEEARRR